MKSKIFTICLSLLILTLIGCGSVKEKNEKVISSNVKPISNNENQESAAVTAIRKEVNMNRNGVMWGNPLSVYDINGEIYINIKDVSGLSKTEYKFENNIITFGNQAQPSASFYIPDISAYPNFDYSSENKVIDYLLDVHWKADGVIEYKCKTLNVMFKDAVKIIDKKLKADNFTLMNEKQYTELTNNLSDFKEGKIKNTYIKLLNDKEEYPLQLIDGAFDGNKTPIILIKMMGKSGYPKKNWLENSNNTEIRASDTSKKDDAKRESVAAIKTKVTVKYYNLQSNIDTYKINQNLYMNINDISRLFRTKIIYDKADNSISFGDFTRANPAFVLDYDLSEYPNLEDIIGAQPSEIWSNSNVINFKYNKKKVSFQNTIKDIQNKLKSLEFLAATEKQFKELLTTSDTSAFMKGEIKNTYIKNNRIKYGNGELSSETFQSVIQINDGGLDKSKNQIIIVKMLDGYCQ